MPDAAYGQCANNVQCDDIGEFWRNPAPGDKQRRETEIREIQDLNSDGKKGCQAVVPHVCSTVFLMFSHKSGRLPCGRQAW